MIRIDTIEDLVRVLDDHPEWLEAVRARLLSRELLELPSRFSNFVEKTERSIEKMERSIEKMERFVEEMNRFVEEMNRFVAATNRQFQSIRDDLGVLKGAHARNAAERNLGLIARSMGLRQRRVLDGGELFDLARAAGADVRDDAIESYVQADLVFEGRERAGRGRVRGRGCLVHGERAGHGAGDAQRRFPDPLHRIPLPPGRGEPAHRRADRGAGRIRPRRVAPPAAQGARKRLTRASRTAAGA